jgi:hypothetical protein
MAGAPIFYIKQNDTLPVLQATLYKGDGTVQDLTTGTVKLSMWNAAGTLVINEAACTIVGPATNGVAQYAWVAADTATAGTFRAEFHVYFASTQVSFPDPGQITVVIDPRVK